MKHIITAFVLLFVVGCGTAEGSDGDLPNVGPATTGGSGGDVSPMGTGSSCACEAGPQGEPGVAGPQGLQGPQGLEGLPGQDGLDGDNCSVAQSGNSATITCGTATATLTGAAGPKGDTGATGSPGAPGATGAQGAQGAQGPKGDKGAPGAPGLVDPSMVYTVLASGSGLQVAACDVGDLILTGGCESSFALLNNAPAFHDVSSSWRWSCSAISNSQVLVRALCVDVDGNR